VLKLLISVALVLLGLAATTLLFNRPLQASPTNTRRVLLAVCIGCVAAGLLAMVLFCS
jgi:hypothetical protein